MTKEALPESPSRLEAQILAVRHRIRELLPQENGRPSSQLRIALGQLIYLLNELDRANAYSELLNDNELLQMELQAVAIQQKPA